MGNDAVARKAGFIPRKSYPMVNVGHLRGMLLAEGLEIAPASAIARVLSKVLEKQAIDERLNYTVIERSLGGGKKYATKVVAASDTLLDDPSQADYVCAGSDDDNTINTAITAAAGGKVLLLDGHYVGGSGVDSVIVNVDGTTLEGMGYGTYLDFTAGSGGVSVSASSCTVRNLRSKGGGNSDGITTSGDNNLIEGCWAQSESGQGISLNNCEKAKVANCQAEGIEILGAILCIVDGNQVTVTADGGMGITDTGALSVVSNNFIDARVAASVTHNFALHMGGEGGIAEGNIVWASGAGWTAILAGGDTNEITIRNNIVYLAARHGIYVFGETHNTSVVGNVVYGASQQTNATYDGIRIDAPNSGDDVLNCMVTNNMVRHLGLANKPLYGINISPSGATKVTNAFVVGNDLKDSGSTAPLIDGGTGTILTYPGHATYGDNRT